MISDAAPATLIAVHPVLADRTWRRLFWCGRRLTSLIWSLAADCIVDPRLSPAWAMVMEERARAEFAPMRAEILHTSAIVGSDALALSLSLPWGAP